MSYTPTPLLRFYVINNLTEQDTWGLLLNDSWRRLDTAISGVLEKTVVGTNITLTDQDYVSTDEAHYAVLRFLGTQTANINCVIPNRAKQYIVINDTVSGDLNTYTVTVKTAGGSGVAFKHNTRGLIVCVGSNTIATVAKTDQIQNISPTAKGTLLVALDANTWGVLPPGPDGTNYLSPNSATPTGLEYKTLVLPTVEDNSILLTKLEKITAGDILIGLPNGDIDHTSPSTFLNLIEPTKRITMLGTAGQHNHLSGYMRTYLSEGGVVWGAGGSNAWTGGVRTAVPHPINPIRSTYAPISKVRSGGSSFYFVDMDGYVYAGGLNNHGQLATGDFTNYYVPVRIEWFVNNGDIRIADVSVMDTESNDQQTAIFRTVDGRVFGAGYNAFGTLGNGSFLNSNIPTQSGTLSNILNIYTSDASVWAWNASELYAWGSNGQGQLGVGDTANKNFPTKVLIGGNDVSNILDIASRDGSTFILVADSPYNKIYATGRNSGYQLGLGDTTERTSFTEQTTIPLALENPIQLDADWFGLAVTEQGNLWNWGPAGHALGRGVPGAAIQVPSKPTGTWQGTITRAMFGGWGSNGHGNCFALSSGRLIGCGYNGGGELGQGDSAVRNTFVPIPFSDYAITDFSTGHPAVNLGHIVVLFENGMVEGCGYSYFGLLGDGHPAISTNVNRVVRLKL